MKQVISLIFAMILAVRLFSQGEDSGTASNFAPTQSCSLTSTVCTGASYNLGSSTSLETPSFGTMSNDVWFSFTAPATLVKVRVCPTGFDAAVEVRSADGSTVISAFNNAASGIKEVSCVGGLTYGSVYKVRIGRVSGTGAGSFQMNIEHHGVSVANNYYPGSSGSACYLPGSSLQRTLPCVGVTYAQTRYYFQGVGVPNIGPCTSAGGTFQLSACSNAFIGGAQYNVTIEAQANDTECGLIWFGTSIPRTILLCDNCNLPWTAANISPNNATLGNICTQFSVAPFLGNYQFRWRFQTDNNNTEFCSNWATGDLSTCSSNVFDCLRYNKIYSVSFGARISPTDPVCWYGPTTIITPSMPYQNITTNECCKWRNANSGFIAGVPIAGYDQYRFRLIPINPCVSTPALTPIGPAITTGWSGSNLLNANGLTTPGTIYLIQEQARILNNSCSNCSGVNSNILGQQTDWGNVCVIGMRNSSSPAVGTPIGCYCTPGLQASDWEPSDIEFDVTYRASETTSLIIPSTSQGQILVVDLASAKLIGRGELLIMNLAGQVLFKQTLLDSDEQIEINLSEVAKLTNGIYVLNVQTTSGSVTEKFFIQN